MTTETSTTPDEPTPDLSGLWAEPTGGGEWYRVKPHEYASTVPGRTCARAEWRDRDGHRIEPNEARKPPSLSGDARRALGRGDYAGYIESGGPPIPPRMW